MAKPLFIAEHACHAHGLLGRLISKIMAFSTAKENRRAIELLATKGAKSILDFGCGHGRWLEPLRRLSNGAHVVGIDYADAMIKEASNRNKDLITSGHIQLVQSKGSTLPFEDGYFDKILTMHTVYFLHPLEDYLSELYRLTAPKGDLLIGFRPGEDPLLAQSLPCEIYRIRTTDEIQTLAQDAGFQIIETITATPPAKSMVWLKLQKS